MIDLKIYLHFKVNQFIRSNMRYDAKFCYRKHGMFYYLHKMLCTIIDQCSTKNNSLVALTTVVNGPANRVDKDIQISKPTLGHLTIFLLIYIQTIRIFVPNVISTSMRQ